MGDESLFSEACCPVCGGRPGQAVGRGRGTLEYLVSLLLCLGEDSLGLLERRAASASLPFDPHPWLRQCALTREDLSLDLVELVSGLARRPTAALSYDTDDLLRVTDSIIQAAGLDPWTSPFKVALEDRLFPVEGKFLL